MLDHVILSRDYPPCYVSVPLVITRVVLLWSGSFGPWAISLLLYLNLLEIPIFLCGGVDTSLYHLISLVNYAELLSTHACYAVPR